METAVINTDNVNELLDNGILNTQKYKKGIQRVKDRLERGESIDLAISRACVEYNINVTSFKYFLLNNSSSVRDTQFFINWQDRLLFDITDMNIAAPADFGVALDCILDKNDFVKYELDVFYARYKNGLSTKDISKLYKLSSDDVEQYISRIMRVLKRPDNTNLLVHGLSYLRDVKNRYKNILDTYGENLVDYSDMSDIPLEKKYFDTRTFNALQRANIHTVGDLIRCDNTKDLRRVRNIGKAGVEQIRKIAKDIYHVDICCR
jgi:hypothetical protein